MKIIIQKKEKFDDKFRVTVAVMDGEKELFGRSIEARTDHEVQHQLDMIHKALAERDAEFEKVTEGEWTPKPVVVAPEPQPVVLTKKEQAEHEALQAKQAIDMKVSEKMAELETLAEEEEKMSKLRRLALENSTIDAKLKEIEALKVTKTK